ncbi:MAG: hypothetical protein RBG1_1C00001G1776 [candidate division Zixibacteria bacterium RBG-1]|nr:MAG: hypothetical protein RBG1_1C00001G1776 [candidate division Zixibacteria bacterium RBG-1]OGC84172.1 MAG: hypothetical protein A2V73_08870 [candidate division Zixibacteria bacterium RBG_19FT_COMBO_42_43]
MKFIKLRKLRVIGLIWLLLGSFSLILAEKQPVSVQSKVDRNSIAIGDRIKYSLTIKYNPKAKLLPLDLGSRLGEFEVQDVKTYPEQKSKKQIINKTEYIITTFNTGKFAIPPLAIIYQDEQGIPKWVLSDSISIEVKSVPKKATDTDDIRGLKPPWEIPGSIWIYIILIGLLISAATGYWYYRNFIRRKPVVVELEIKRPAWEVALQELENLRKTDLVNTGKVKEYYFGLSEILRKYMENRFNLACIDRTSEEIKAELKNGVLEQNIKDRFLNFLAESDLVKFAKYIPAQKKTEEDWETVYNLVKETIPAEPTELSQKQEQLLEVGHV